MSYVCWRPGAGLYEPIRNFYHSGSGDPPLWAKIAAGMTSGTIGISIANPVSDLVGSVTDAAL